MVRKKRFTHIIVILRVKRLHERKNIMDGLVLDGVNQSWNIFVVIVKVLRTIPARFITSATVILSSSFSF